MAQLVDLGQWKVKETQDSVRLSRGSLNGARRELEDCCYFAICYNNTLAYVTNAIEQSLDAFKLVTEAHNLFRQIQFVNPRDSPTFLALNHLEMVMTAAIIANENALEAKKLAAEVFQLKNSRE